MIDTLKEAFEGNRELFRELWLYDHYEYDKPILDNISDNVAALEQILNKGFAKNYRSDAIETFLIGVEFDRDKRNIVWFG